MTTNKPEVSVSNYTPEIYETSVDFGNAVSLDGVNDYLKPNTSLPATDEITIETWIRPNFNNELVAILNADGWSNRDIHLQFDSNNQLRMGVNGNNAGVVSSYNFESGNLYHIAAVYSATNKSAQFYVNGELTDSFSYTTAPSIAASSFTIGAWNNNSYIRHFEGEIDEFVSGILLALKTKFKII